ncbi:hypothetical protein [Marivirga lumbricoides]|uniref:hypothetical protein n=1 Tax=Marivirga lumbricoides TaxID=1046115 RepID=UPI0016686ABE
MQIKKLIHKIELNTSSKALFQYSNLSRINEVSFLLLILVIASTILVYCTSGGLIWTSDSFQYWAASRSFQENYTLVSADGGSYIYWPPLFPVILSLFTSESSFYFAHIAFFNLALIFIYLFLKEVSSSGKLALITLSLFCISLFPYLIASFFWTEILFTLFLFSGLYYYLLWKRKRNLISFICWVVLFSCMCLQRNAGIFMMVGLSLYEVLLFLPRKKFKEILFTGMGIVMSVLPNILWNFSLLKDASSTDSEVEIHFLNGFFINLYHLLLTLFNSLFPTQLAPQLSPLFFICSLSVLIFIIIKKSNFLPLILFITYIILLSCMPLIEVESMDRFFAPLLPLFIYLLLSVSSLQFISLKKPLKYCMIFLAGGIVLYNVMRTYQNVERWHQRSITNPKEAKIFF